MSVCTTAKLDGHVTMEEVLAFVKNRFDPDAKITNTNHRIEDEIRGIKVRYDDSGKWITDCGYICFKETSGYTRVIFYAYDNVNFYENEEHYAEEGLLDMVHSETTYLSMGCYDNAVGYMDAIVSHFGGWLDINDCDDVSYQRVDKVQ